MLAGVQRVLSGANLKRSLALKGRPKSPQHVEKVRRALLGRKASDAARCHMSEAHVGKRLSASTRQKLSKARLREWALGQRKLTFTPESQLKTAAKAAQRVGALNHRWIEDRAKLAKLSEGAIRNCAHHAWSAAVKRRDGGCVLAGLGYGPCSGRLEAHHILSCAEHEKLRYEVDNGVTVCHGHHPFKRSKALALVPVFEKLVLKRKGVYDYARH